MGSTNRQADHELVEELRRFARGEAFDEQPVPDLDSEALDFRAAAESFAPVRRIARRDLEVLRLVTDHQGRKVPTIGGVLLFGRDRERHFPDAWIQAGRFRGTDKSRIHDRTEIRSHPVRAIEEAIAFVQKHGLHGAEIGAVRRKERWNLPPVGPCARREIENPGLLPFGLTIEDLPRGVSKLRNRVIGRVFHLPSALGRRRWKRPTGPSSMPWRVARGCSRARSQGRST